VTHPRRGGAPGAATLTDLGLLHDGRTLRVRDLGPQDYGAAREVNAGLSDRSSYLRYFGHLERCGDGEIRRIVTDSPSRISLLGLIDMRPVALAEADGLDAPAGGEIALAVDDDLQGQGVGTLLLAELVRRAESCGALRLRADVLHDNRVMLEVLQHSGLHLSLTSDRDADHITMALPTFGHAATEPRDLRLCRDRDDSKSLEA
jgi:GNAT superfamily N-acetyltransferase